MRYIGSLSSAIMRMTPIAKTAECILIIGVLSEYGRSAYQNLDLWIGEPDDQWQSSIKTPVIVRREKH